MTVLRRSFAALGPDLGMVLCALMLCACSSGDEPARATTWPPEVGVGGGVGAFSNDGAYYVVYAARPQEVPLNEDFEVDLRVFDADTRQEIGAGAEIFVDARMPAHNHGMKHDEVEKLSKIGRSALTLACTKLNKHHNYDHHHDYDDEYDHHNDGRRRRPVHDGQEDCLRYLQ